VFSESVRAGKHYYPSEPDWYQILLSVRARTANSSIYQYLPDATMSDARGGQTGLKVLEKNLFKLPIFPASGDQVYS